jgi:hypothetical protein
MVFLAPRCQCGRCLGWFLGVDMDGLACFLHRPMVCVYQTRVQRFLTVTALSRHATVSGNAFLRVRGPWDGIFDMVLTIWVPDVPNPSWRSLLLLGCAYPASELS